MHRQFQHACSADETSFCNCSACPKSGPVPSIIKQYQAFYNILQGMSQERACPKNEPVPSIFEGMIGYDRACPKSGPVPNIS